MDLSYPSTSRGIERSNRARFKVVIGTIDQQKVRALKRILLKTFTIFGDPEKHEMGLYEFGDPWTELHFEASCSRWDTLLLKLSLAFQQCAFDVLKGDDTPYLHAVDRAAFIDDCISAHMEVPLSTVRFGNLKTAGLFLSHFRREATNKSLDVLRRVVNRRITCPMFVDFEHDRNVLTVRFGTVDGKGYQRDNELNGIAKNREWAVAMRVKYMSVRRIIVDTMVKKGEEYFTRMFLQLNYPPEIRKFQRKSGPETSFYDGDRHRWVGEYDDDKRQNCAAINDSPVICLRFTKRMKEGKLYSILSRLHARIGLPVEFATIHTKYFPVENYVPPPVRIIGNDFRKEASEEEVKRNGYTLIEPKVDAFCSKQLHRRGTFGLEYLVAALLSRGAVVKDQILESEESRDAFIKVILTNFDKNKEVTLEALERLLNMLDEVKQVPSLTKAFEKICFHMANDNKFLHELYDRTEEGGYTRVRKVVVTPTRLLFVVPELLMGNRVLRNFDEDGDGALRVQFRDDDGSHLRRNNTGIYIIQGTVHNTLLHGIHISDRHFVYLASSNSQMRDSGCYFFDDGAGGKAQKIRKKLGKFDKTNIPKLMSRMGQCFTQAKACGIQLRRARYNKTFDFTGGKNMEGGQYTFSDGVGRMSVEFAKKISEDLELEGCVPSCFQIRHRGMKGVLSVDPALDCRKRWAAEHHLEDNPSRSKRMNELYVLFRPSQEKFLAPRSEDIEIVKYSAPTPVCLNRPFISILDQVSAMQGYAMHNRISNRIHGLLDIQLMELANMLMSEDKCRERLNEFPRRFDVNRLSLTRGFTLTQEPFFRSLLRASARYTLRKQLAKEQIQIPYNLGRSMFGVVDETGLLQYGQVFIQYTNNISLKFPKEGAARTVLTGRVLMTKNPSIVAGDARVFDAIDIPQLRHLVNVVVFPQHGQRPHPDEMAGSDLDGDEYSVIWDPEMLLDYNEVPHDFAKSFREAQDVREDEVVSEMRRFFVSYIEQDSIGTIANAFLANSDLYGISSEVCRRIADKHSQSVDFPKTGMPPDPLVKKWTESNGTFIPPERPERFPDFMTKPFELSYESPRLVGQLFRRIRLVDDVLTLTAESEEQLTVELDEMLDYPRKEKYLSLATKIYNSYCAHIRALLDNYGIEDEGQLFSGCISVIRNRISDRDMDDMSLFNTNHMIEKKVTAIFMMFRRDFFEEFGGYLSVTEPDGKKVHNDTEFDERRVCTNPSADMKAKAAAYYEVCYGKASRGTSDKRLLSFPWVAWDVLAQVKHENRSRSASFRVCSVDPLAERISEFIDDFCSAHDVELKSLIHFLTEESLPAVAVKKYCRRYKGLEKLIFVLCKWAEMHELFNDSLTMAHLCILLIRFGCGNMPTEGLSSRPAFLDETEKLLEVGSAEIVDMSKLLGGIGKCFLLFLQYLSSRAFETLNKIDFCGMDRDFNSIFLRGQWLDLHKAAVKSFYRIVLTSRFDELPVGESLSVVPNESAGVTEMEPFMIELPDGFFELRQFKEKMLKYSGARYIELRKADDRSNRLIISAVGTLKSLHRLRDMLAIKPMLNSSIDGRVGNQFMLRLLYNRILDLCV